MPDQSPVAVEFRDVNFRLPDGRYLLRHLNLAVRRGETLMLLGRSGSGKTTSLKMINRLLEPTSGEVLVEGKPVAQWDPIELRRRIGYAIQDVGLFPHYTVWQNVTLVPRLERWERQKLDARGREVLELVGMSDAGFVSRYPAQLSGGQRQRVGLARALAAEPPILLMDEPFGALDPITRSQLQGEFKALQRKLAKTVVFVTHDVAEALLLGDRIALMEDGSLQRSLHPPRISAIRQCGHQRVHGHFPRWAGAVARSGKPGMNFIFTHSHEVATLTAEHLWLVGISMLLAIAAGVPLGILLTRRPRWKTVVLGSSNIVQTIPSLALFGLLLPLPWLGARADRLAILALALYALLPIVRNTYVGISGISPPVREAAVAMGLTPSQMLWQVELPLGLPVMLAGIRTATVITIGVATIAAAIGAGGLGEFIFRGIAMVDNGVILAGAIPAALMALVADGLLGLRREAAEEKARLAMQRRTFLQGLSAAAVVALAGCSSQNNALVIGSKNFTEQLLLGELLAQYLGDTCHIPVDRRFYLAGTYICQQALLAGRIDLYVEYTGTALAAILKEKAAGDSEAVYREVKQQYQRRFGLEVMPPLGFNNSFAMVMRGDDARRMGIARLSQLAPFAPKLRLGVGYEFLERQDGYPGLIRTYDLRFADAPQVMDLGLLYRALENRSVDIVAGSNTDGLIQAMHLVVLDDDRHYFPPYDAVPIVRPAVFQRVALYSRCLAASGGTNLRRRYARHELRRGRPEAGRDRGGGSVPQAARADQLVLTHTLQPCRIELK